MHMDFYIKLCSIADDRFYSQLSLSEHTRNQIGHRALEGHMYDINEKSLKYRVTANIFESSKER